MPKKHLFLVQKIGYGYGGYPPPPPLRTKFSAKRELRIWGVPPPPFTEKIRKVVFEVPPYNNPGFLSSKHRFFLFVPRLLYAWVASLFKLAQDSISIILSFSQKDFDRLYQPIFDLIFQGAQLVDHGPGSTREQGAETRNGKTDPLPSLPWLC